MSSSPRPVLYRPVFGNDNFYAPDNIDIAAFTSPALNMKDAAIVASTKKVSEKI
jgi:hypothetical protein